MSRPTITLTTDFGLRDPYVAEMKAVILSINPNVTIVDVSHQIEKFNVRMGAYVLASAVPYFHKGTIHVGVVDPGVGTKRHPVVIQTECGYFVGPDNGLFALAVKNIEGKMQMRKIANQKFMLLEMSDTFHGRDIFAPVAAYLAKGTPITDFGPKISQIRTLAFARIIRKRDSFLGEVIHIDDFGNIITNFGARELEAVKTKSSVSVKVKNVKLTLKLCKAYGDVEKQQPLAIIGSHNFLEISMNQGSAANVLKVEAGDEVVLYRS